MKYGISKQTGLDFEKALEKITEELKKEGFGIITTIDMKDTLKKKIDVDFKRYTILGACNPKLAFTALGIEEEIGLLLPCNVIVYESEEGTTVSIFNPAVISQISQNPQLQQFAAEVKIRLEIALSNLS